MCKQLHPRMGTFSFLLQGIEQLRVLVLLALVLVTKKQVLKDNQPLFDRLFPVPFASHQVAEDLPAINY